MKFFSGGIHMVRRALSMFVLVIAAVDVSADVVATCGASEGWGYYVPGGSNPDQNPEWVKDAISKGSFQLIRSGDDFDIVFTDSTGGTVSTKGDGGTTAGEITPDG